MEKFIAHRIEYHYDIAHEDGQELYRKFFINARIYKRFKAKVDEILIADGYEDAIVTK
jgi:hypothetical protein